MDRTHQNRAACSPVAHSARAQHPLVPRAPFQIYRKAACACGGGCPRCSMQSKLLVGPGNDAYEREADAVAHQMMRPTPARAATQVLRRLPRSEAPAAGMPAPPTVEQALRGSGRSLDARVRATAETRLGQDFSRVQVHDDAQAAASANDVDARAYTAGNHIVFAPGRYDPQSPVGQQLIFHELAHVVQQESFGMHIPRLMRQAAPAPIFGKSCSGGATDPCQQARCTPGQITTAGGDIVRAIGYVDAAVTALNASPLAPATVRALDWFYVSHDLATANEVKRRLGCIRACLSDTQTNSRFGCHPDDRNLGYVCMGATPLCSQAQVRVCLTNDHFSTNDRERAETVIHECAHRVGMSLGRPVSVPDMYRFTARFMNLSTDDALLNADSFAMFAGAITEGVRVSVIPVFSLAGGVAGVGGSATWWGRLYGGAEFQHPRLSIFNPTLGVGMTMIGDPTTPAPGAQRSSPSLMFSLLAGVRIGNPRPGGAGGPYLSVFGGPSLAIGTDVKVGAEAGVALGYRWRWLDVSAGAGYDYDPTRVSGSRDIPNAQLRIGLIPLFDL